MTGVQVLGASGMLGGALTAVLEADSRIEVEPVSRSIDGLDVREGDLEAVLARSDAGWVLNAVGVLRSRIDESDLDSVAAARAVNAEFPHRLAELAGALGKRVVHFSTDAVFAGDAAPYYEDSRPDAGDVYGSAKAAGEVSAPHVVNVRCSIVGIDPGEPRSLLGWALSQPRGARIDGYTNHLWNGLTSVHLARLCAALVSAGDADRPRTLHPIPADSVTKSELLERALAAFGREDVKVTPTLAPQPIDLRLATRHPALIGELWREAGYPRAPGIAEMLREFAISRARGGH